MEKNVLTSTIEEKILGGFIISVFAIFIISLPFVAVKLKEQNELLTTMIDRVDNLSGASVNHETRLYDVQMKIESMQNTLSEHSGSLSFLDERRKDIIKQLNQSESDIRAILQNKYNCTGDLYFVNSRDNINETDVTSLIYGDIDELYISDRQYNREILCLDKLQFAKHFIRY